MSKLLSMMMSNSGGGGTVGTPVLTTNASFVSNGSIVDFMAYKNGKYWFRGTQDDISYSTNADLSSPSTITLHKSGSTIIFGNNINIGITWAHTASRGDYTDIDIYDNDMTYIRTVSTTYKLGASNAVDNLSYMIYNGYIYILASGGICKIEDNTSVTTASAMTDVGGGGFALGEVENGEVLITCGTNIGNSGNKYYVAKLNLDTMTVTNTTGQIAKSYSKWKATSCVKFNNKYYLSVEGTLYSSDDLTLWTAETYDKVYYRMFIYDDVCYTVAKDGIYTTTDLNTSTLWIATTLMTNDYTTYFRNAQAFDSALIFCYSQAGKTECVVAPIV